MKRLIVILFIIVSLLCGCTKSPVSTKAPTENNTETPTVQNTQPVTDATEHIDATEAPAPVYTQQPMVAISAPIVYESTKADDGTIVFNYSYQYINLVVQDQQIADTIIIDFLNRQDNNQEIVKSVSDQALSDYSSDETWTPYFFESSYSPTRIDHSVLSLFGQNIIYAGENRPQRESLAANYNMITGDVLTLGSILDSVESLDSLCELVIENMALIKDEMQIYDDYADAVRHRFAREESYDEDWFFTETGLNFYFAPYEVAPYISGVVTVEVPYEQLAGIIADDYFPAEEDYAEGAIHAQPLSDTDLQAFTQIAEVPMDTNGELIFIYCDGILRDIQIEIGSWNESITEFTPTCTIFSMYALTPGDGITIQADIPDGAPNLRLTYRSGDQIHTAYITLSGKDGSVILMNSF